MRFDPWSCPEVTLVGGFQSTAEDKWGGQSLSPVSSTALDSVGPAALMLDPTRLLLRALPGAGRAGASSP